MDAYLVNCVLCAGRNTTKIVTVLFLSYQYKYKDPRGLVYNFYKI